MDLAHQPPIGRADVLEARPGLEAEHPVGLLLAHRGGLGRRARRPRLDASPLEIGVEQRQRLVVALGLVEEARAARRDRARRASARRSAPRAPRRPSRRCRGRASWRAPRGAGLRDPARRRAARAGADQRPAAGPSRCRQGRARSRPGARERPDRAPARRMPTRGAAPCERPLRHHPVGGEADDRDEQRRRRARRGSRSCAEIGEQPARRAEPEASSARRRRRRRSRPRRAALRSSSAAERSKGSITPRVRRAISRKARSAAGSLPSRNMKARVPRRASRPRGRRGGRRSPPSRRRRRRSPRPALFRRLLLDMLEDLADLGEAAVARDPDHHPPQRLRRRPSARRAPRPGRGNRRAGPRGRPRCSAARKSSACRSQAASQVGWRLIVASRAKIRRPRGPSPDAAGRRGATALAIETKASMSRRDERAPVAPSAGLGVRSLRFDMAASCGRTCMHQAHLQSP
jgi:hypothetical protein